MARLFYILLFVPLFCGCEKYQYNRQPGGGLEFRYIDDLERVGTSHKIINSTVVVSEKVFIYYDEIESYDPGNHIFKLTSACAARIGDMRNNPLHGKPFAVTIDGELIYTGYFWASFSSSIVDWITIDPLAAGFRNELYVQLGYPGLFSGDYIPDNRNDQRIINLFREDNKLVR